MVPLPQGERSTSLQCTPIPQKSPAEILHDEITFLHYPESVTILHLFPIFGEAR